MGRAAAAEAVCLILGRVHAGVLNTCDATTVWDQVEDILGFDLLIELDALTAEACTLDDDDTNGLVDVATRFAAALDEPAPTGRGGDSGGDTADRNADDTGVDEAVAAGADAVLAATVFHFGQLRIDAVKRSWRWPATRCASR